MATKIDQSEGSIMSDLEGMESKRLEQATKVAMEFEDRYVLFITIVCLMQYFIIRFKLKVSSLKLYFSTEKSRKYMVNKIKN